MTSETWKEFTTNLTTTTFMFTSGQPMLRTECLGGVNSPPPPPNQQRWLPFHAKVKVDCWSSPCRSLTHPPGSTEAIAFSCESESWLLILSALIVDPPSQDQQCWSPLCWSPLCRLSICPNVTELSELCVQLHVRPGPKTFRNWLNTNFLSPVFQQIIWLMFF